MFCEIVICSAFAFSTTENMLQNLVYFVDIPSNARAIWINIQCPRFLLCASYGSPAFSVVWLQKDTPLCASEISTKFSLLLPKCPEDSTFQVVISSPSIPHVNIPYSLFNKLHIRNWKLSLLSCSWWESFWKDVSPYVHTHIFLGTKTWVLLRTLPHHHYDKLITILWKYGANAEALPELSF